MPSSELEDRNRNEPDDQDVERREPAMHQHLVDHDLEEDRCDQGEELQEEGGDQDLGQNPAIFVDRLNEPGDVEFPGQVAQRRAPSNQDQAPVPTGLEFGATEELRSANGGVLNQRLVIDKPGQHQKAAIAAFRQGGERNLRKPPPIRDDRPRLELQLLGAPQNLRGTKGRAGELMADLRRVDGQFMETQNQNERIDARAWNALSLQTHRGPPHH